jgi:proteasome beta subunit
MTIEEGIDLAVRSITAAMNRDSASGGMINVAVIDKNGFKEIPADQIRKKMDKLKA